MSRDNARKLIFLDDADCHRFPQQGERMQSEYSESDPGCGPGYGLISVAAFLLLWVILGGYAFGNAQMGMKINSVEIHSECTSIATTGAEFVLDQTHNVIICHQRIPQRRQVATIRGLSLDGLKLLSQDGQSCVFGPAQGSPLVTIGADSVLRISLAAGANVGITGAYQPAWQGRDGNHVLLPDATGGVGMYLIGNGNCQTPASWKPGWTVNYQATSSSQLLVSVFPPRPFDVNRSRETMLHAMSSNHPYPANRELAEWREIGPVLTLHSWIWQGSHGSAYGIERDDSWATATFVPKNERELRRVVETAHRLGMKVIPYASPFYFGNSDGSVGKETMPEYLNKLQSVLTEYGFDGVYLDGLYGNDVEGSYELVRRLRRMIGDDKIMYIHSTGMPLSKMCCPFIDTYATYTLRGEHTRLTKEYARWFVSSYNLGNSVGTFCYDSNRPNSEVIDLLLSNNARLPYWVQDGTWSGLKYHLSPDEAALMNREYFPKLLRVR